MTEIYSEGKIETIQKLALGDWANLKIDIPKWLDDGEYDILCALVCGCHKTKDINILYILEYLLSSKVNHPLTKVMSIDTLKEIIKKENASIDTTTMREEELKTCASAIIISNCCLVIKEIIWTITDLKKERISNESEEKCDEILSDLGKNKNRYIRMYVAGAIDTPHTFLQDPDKRVQKIASIRTSFYDTLSNRANPLYEKQIDFITCALETGVIKPKEGIGLPTKEDVMFAKFDSTLFIPNEKYYAFDRNIFYNIKDNRILASEIIKMINLGTISFAEGMTPSYFKETAKKLEKK